jgi:hypothetical protein
MSPTTRWSLPTLALATAVVACAEPTTAPTEFADLFAGPIASSGAAPKASTGFPSGTTLYKFNLLGVPKGKTPSMTGDQGKRMFIPLWGNAKIYLQQGPFDVIDANGTDANGATFQLPDPQLDDTEYTWYGVYVRPKGTPGGKATLTSCKVVDSEELCSTESYVLVRGTGKPTVENVSKELLTVCLDLDHIVESNPCDVREFLFDDDLAQYLWNVDNQGLRNAEIRFIEIPQGPFTQP